MKNSDDKKVEGNIVVFEDLGVYSRDREKDQEINNKLIDFLKMKGIKLAQIKYKHKN